MGQSPSSSAPSSPSSVRKAKSPSNQRVKARISARFNELAVARPPLETVERGLLIEVLSCPGAEDFGELLLGVHKEDINDLKETDYVHAICEALGLEVEDGSSTTTESRLTFYFSVFCVSRLDNIIDQKRFFKMLRYACILGLASGTAASVAVPEDHPTILALMQSAMKNVRDKEAITITEFVDWASTTCPDLFSGIVRWVELQGLAEGSEGDLWATDHHLPSFDEGKADKKLLDYVSLWALSTALPPLYKKSTMWTLLYTSNENGLSFNRFQHHVGHYDGPTVLIFHTDCDALFGACVDMEWKETESARGRDNCHLFAIQPQFHFEHNGIKFYENEKTRHQDHGIGFGSDANHRGTADLWIENDLTKCTVRFAPVVQRGSSKEFKIRSIEVWGCADPDVAAKQHSERVRDRTMAELRQRVKRPTNVETDRYLLDLAGVNTSQAQAQIDITAEKATSKLSTNTEFVPGSL